MPETKLIQLLEKYLEQVRALQAMSAELRAIGIQSYTEKEFSEATKRIWHWITKVSASELLSDDLLQKLSDALDEMDLGSFSADGFIENMKGPALRAFERAEKARLAVIEFVQG